MVVDWTIVTGSSIWFWKKSNFLSLRWRLHEPTFDSAGKPTKNVLWVRAKPTWDAASRTSKLLEFELTMGSVEGHIICSHVFDQTLNRETFLEFLKFFFHQFQKILPCKWRGTSWWLPVSLLPKRTSSFRRAISESCYWKGILISTDIPCLDLHIWGRLKDLRFSRETNNYQN